MEDRGTYRDVEPIIPTSIRRFILRIGALSKGGLTQELEDERGAVQIVLKRP